MSGVDILLWAIPPGLALATVASDAVAEVLVTRMKLIFAMKVLQPPGGRVDPEAARKDLDAARRFMASGPRRAAARLRWPQLCSWRTANVRGAPTRDETAGAAGRAAAA